MFAMSRRSILRSIVLLMLVLVALSLASHFLYDITVSSPLMIPGAADRHPAPPGSTICNALLHSGLAGVVVLSACWALLLFRFKHYFHQVYRSWAPPVPFHPPITA
jgi:hypothetical protein